MSGRLNPFHGMRRTVGLANFARAGVALILALCGCADRSREGTSVSEDPLLVMAATSLNTAMPDLIDSFTARTGTEIDLVLGATGNLAAQIENGAPGDVFFAADEATVERLARSGLLEAQSRRTYAVGRVAMVWRDGITPPANLVAVAGDEYEVVSLANPEHAPYGMAAREALRRSGIWDRVEPRIVYGENVAQAYQFVVTGNADVGLVARSVVDTAAVGHLLVDSALHVPVRQAASILQRSIHPQAEPFLSFVLSPEGQRILDAHGFGDAPR